MFFFYSENIWSSSTRLEEEIFPKSNQQKYRFFCRVLFFQFFFKQIGQRRKKKTYKAGGVSCQLRNTIVKQRWESWVRTKNQRDKMMDFRIFSKPTKEEQQPTYVYIQKKEATQRNQIYNKSTIFHTYMAACLLLIRLFRQLVSLLFQGHHCVCLKVNFFFFIFFFLVVIVACRLNGK